MFGLFKSKAEKIATAMIDVAFCNSVGPEEFAAVRQSGIDQNIYKVEVNALQAYITLYGFLVWSNGTPEQKIEAEVIEKYYALMNEHCRKNSPIPEQYYILLRSRINEYSEARKRDDAAPDGVISIEFPRVFVANLTLENGEIPFEFMDTVRNRYEYIVKQLQNRFSRIP